MNYILYDGPQRKQLLPFTFTKPVADLRIGILTIREKWEMHLAVKTSTHTETYLAEKFPLHTGQENIMINGAYLPTDGLIEEVKNLRINEALIHKGDFVAYYANNVEKTPILDQFELKTVSEESVFNIEHTWDLFSKNGLAITEDFKLLTQGRISQPIPDSVRCINKEDIFLEEGAKIEASVLNATNGPIYLGKNSEVMEGSLIRGPFSLGLDSVVKMGAKIYGPTTVGPYCKLGGEVNNSILMGYSNKGHDGFLGNSVLGEWCNLGADTNTSNLKNNYADVKLWDYETQKFMSTGLQFCGLMMGDHSKCSINTMFNTGTVVGVCSNIFGSDFPRNFVPSFSWGGSSGITTYRTEKAFETVRIVMQRRNLDFDAVEQRLLQHVFDQTVTFRGE